MMKNHWSFKHCLIYYLSISNAEMRLCWIFQIDVKFNICVFYECPHYFFLWGQNDENDWFVTFAWKWQCAVKIWSNPKKVEKWSYRIISQKKRFFDLSPGKTKKKTFSTLFLGISHATIHTFTARQIAPNKLGLS